MSSSSPTTSSGRLYWMIPAFLLTSCLFFWPACLDYYLAPRFFMASLLLLPAALLLWRNKAEWDVFGMALWGWYAFNVAAAGWSLRFTEGLFYAQKVLIVAGVYAWLRYAFARDAARTQAMLRQGLLWLSGIVAVVLGGRTVQALLENGLDNEGLYSYFNWLFGNKSLSAAFCYFLCVFNAFYVLSSAKGRQRVLHGGLAVLFALLVLVLQARTVYLALGLSAVLYIAWLGRKSAWWVLGGVVAAIALLVAMGKAERLNPLQYMDSDTANERRFVWYKTDLLNAEHYWWGVGNGSWKFMMPSKSVDGGYRLSEGNVVFTRAHNDYLEIRSEMGMAGALVFCGLFVWAFAAGIRRHNSGLERMALTALAGYCVIQFFDFPRERIEFQVLLGLLFALADPASMFKGKTPKTGSWLNLLLVGGLALNVWIGWQRMSGEGQLSKLMDAQARSNWKSVLRQAQLAENPFHEYTDAAIPIAWHEGIAHFQTGNYDAAVKAFERAYQLNPWSFQVVNNYASALVQTKRYTEAIPLFEKALQINPSYDEGKFNLSYTWMQLKDTVRAAEWLEKVDTIKTPGNAADKAKNAATLQRLQQFRAALQAK